MDNMVYMYHQVSLSWEVEYPVDCRKGYFLSYALVNTGWQWPAVVPTQEATQPSYSPSVGNGTNKPKTDQENHILRDPSYNIARLT